MVKEIRSEKAIIRVHRPDLTPEERDRQMEKIRQAAVRLWEATQRVRQEKGCGT